MASGREVRTLTGHTDHVSAVTVNSDGKRAVSASCDHSLKARDAETGTLIATFSCDAPALCCMFAGDQQIVAGGASGRVHFLSLEL